MHNEADVLEEIKMFLRDNYLHKPVLFWDSDKFFFLISRNLSFFKKNFLFLFPDKYAFFLRKDLMFNIAQNSGFNLPSWSIFYYNSEVNISFPCVVKPINSLVDVGFKIMKISSLQEYNSFKEKYKHFSGKLLLQKLINSREFLNIQILCCQDKILAIDAFRKIRTYPVWGGTSTFVKSTFSFSCYSIYY